jgi:transcriptional regulator with XRE-family HTH domain
MNNIKIGKRIKGLRKEKNLNQKAVAERIRKTTATVSHLEKGQIELSPLVRLAICNIFNVNEHWLMTGEGPKYNETMQKIEEKIKELGEDAYIKYIMMKSAYKLRQESTQAILEEKARYGSYDELADPELYDILSKVALLCEDKEKKEALKRLIDLLVGEK